MGKHHHGGGHKSHSHHASIPSRRGSSGWSLYRSGWSQRVGTVDVPLPGGGGRVTGMLFFVAFAALWLAFVMGSAELFAAAVVLVVVVVGWRATVSQRERGQHHALLDQIAAASEQEHRAIEDARLEATPASLVRMLVAIPSESRASIETLLVSESQPRALLARLAQDATLGALTPLAQSVDTHEAKRVTQSALDDLDARDHVSSELGYRGAPTTASTAGPGLAVLAVTFVARDVGALPSNALQGAELVGALDVAVPRSPSAIVDHAHRWLPVDPSHAFAPNVLASVFPELHASA